MYAKRELIDTSLLTSQIKDTDLHINIAFFGAKGHSEKRGYLGVGDTTIVSGLGIWLVLA